MAGLHWSTNALSLRRAAAASRTSSCSSAGTFPSDRRCIQLRVRGIRGGTRNLAQAGERSASRRGSPNQHRRQAGVGSAETAPMPRRPRAEPRRSTSKPSSAPIPQDHSARPRGPDHIPVTAIETGQSGRWIAPRRPLLLKHQGRQRRARRRKCAGSRSPSAAAARTLLGAVLRTEIRTGLSASAGLWSPANAVGRQSPVMRSRPEFAGHSASARRVLLSGTPPRHPGRQPVRGPPPCWLFQSDSSYSARADPRAHSSIERFFRKTGQPFQSTRDRHVVDRPGGPVTRRDRSRKQMRRSPDDPISASRAGHPCVPRRPDARRRLREHRNH